MHMCQRVAFFVFSLPLAHSHGLVSCTLCVPCPFWWYLPLPSSTISGTAESRHRTLALQLCLWISLLVQRSQSLVANPPTPPTSYHETLTGQDERRNGLLFLPLVLWLDPGALLLLLSCHCRCVTPFHCC